MVHSVYFFNFILLFFALLIDYLNQTKNYRIKILFKLKKNVT